MKGNRDQNRGLELKYVPPPGEDGMAEITEMDIEEGRAVWKNAVVGYILGEKPSFKEVVGFVHRAWGKIQIPRIHFLKPGIFLFNFSTKEAKKESLARFWNFNKSPMVLKDWVPSFKLSECNPEVIPIWVQFPGLDLQFWTYQGFCKMASLVSKPVMADFLTCHREKLDYAICGGKGWWETKTHCLGQNAKWRSVLSEDCIRMDAC